jgi:hypothetical protein
MRGMADQPQDDTENSMENNRAAPWLDPYRWKPGQTGNAGGRPRRKPLTDAYAAILEELVPGDKQGRTFAEIIAMALVREAVKGRVNAAAEIADRVEGKTLASMAISGPDGGAIPLANLTAADLTDSQLAAILLREK